MALDYQQRSGLPQARVSRFAAIGLGLAHDDVGFRLRRTLAVAAVAIAYSALVCVLIVEVIPHLAGYHGS